jgi:hypothetical protein
VCVCVCVCVGEGEGERESKCAFACLCAYVCVCVCVLSVCVFERLFVGACVCFACGLGCGYWLVVCAHVAKGVGIGDAPIKENGRRIQTNLVQVMENAEDARWRCGNARHEHESVPVHVQRSPKDLRGDEVL